MVAMSGSVDHGHAPVMSCQIPQFMHHTPIVAREKAIAGDISARQEVQAAEFDIVPRAGTARSHSRTRDRSHPPAVPAPQPDTSLSPDTSRYIMCRCAAASRTSQTRCLRKLRCGPLFSESSPLTCCGMRSSRPSTIYCVGIRHLSARCTADIRAPHNHARKHFSSTAPPHADIRLDE
jgi:hypothetical protein